MPIHHPISPEFQSPITSSDSSEIEYLSDDCSGYLSDDLKNLVEEEFFGSHKGKEKLTHDDDFGRFSEINTTTNTDKKNLSVQKRFEHTNDQVIDKKDNQPLTIKPTAP